MAVASPVARTLAVAGLCAATGALADRPLSTEDAYVVGHGRCQVEAWLDRSRIAATGWFVPACNFGANIEWQAGFARQRADGADRTSAAFAQMKTVFKPVDDASPWGWGLSAGVSRQPLQHTHRGWENPYAVVPVSLAFGTTLVHVAPGWSRNRAARRNATVWGGAVEHGVTGRLTVLAEAFGENSARPFVRAGGRWSVVEGFLDIDLTVVGRPGGGRDERFVSLGLLWQSPRLTR